MTPGQLENFLYKCIMRTIYANKLADRNVQHFESVFYCVERLLKRSFVYDLKKIINTLIQMYHSEVVPERALILV